MRIAVLQEHMLYFNGGIRYLFEVTRRLAKDNDVTIFAGDASLSNVEKFVSAGVNVNTCWLTFENSIKYWLCYPYYMAKNALGCRRIAQNYKVDVFLSMNPSTSLACLIARIKPIIVCMELNPWLWSASYISGLSPLKRCIVKFWSPVAKYLEKLAYRNARRIIVWSKFVQSELKRVYGVDSEVVYTGIDTEFFEKTENQELKEKYKGKRIILHVASYLSPMKGTDYAIRAMGYVNKEFPDTLLVIITSDKNEKRQAELFGLALKNKANISFIIGVKDEDMPLYYSLAECLLAPSLDENIHLPQLEAQSCQCPVVCFEGKMETEEMQDYTTGFLAYNRSAQSLAECVIDILSNEGMKGYMGRNGQQFVINKFNWDKCVDSYRRIIKEVTR
jgi:glycosyltransferase involved in cell wall biosynthesis